MKREIMVCDRCMNRVGPDNPAVISEQLSDGRQFQICGVCFLDMEAVASIETIRASDNERVIVSNLTQRTPRGHHQSGFWESQFKALALDQMILYYPEDSTPVKFLLENVRAAIHL